MTMVKEWTRTRVIWWLVLLMMTMLVLEVVSLSGPNVCMVQQKYNITKRVKYRAPMSVRTYEWCFSMPPRCSKWSTEMRDLTRLETEERTAEVAVCCPGYKMKDVSCVPICPSGKTGHGCSEDCPPNKWGPNCVNDCGKCVNGVCSPTSGDCDCDDGWQGESCQISMPTTPTPPALMEEILTTTKSTIKTPSTTITTTSTTKGFVSEIPTTKTSPMTTTVLTTKKLITTTEKTETTPVTVSTIKTTKATSPIMYDNETIISTTSWIDIKVTAAPITTITNFIYNRTEIPVKGTSTSKSTEHETPATAKITTFSTESISDVPITNLTNTTITTTTKSTTTTITTPSTTTSTPSTSFSTTTPQITTFKLTTRDDTKTETTRKPETTTKAHPSTIKFKPKEIWIKPTQKGEISFIETKVKNNQDLFHTKNKSVTYKNEDTSVNTTPKTIIVSIIPTSVSHATFKKIALTTASYLSPKPNIISNKTTNRTEQGFTKSMTSFLSTAIPFTIKVISAQNSKTLSSQKTISNTSQSKSTRTMVTPLSKKMSSFTTVSDKSTLTSKSVNASVIVTRSTNSMLSTLNDVNKKFIPSTSLATKTLTNKKYIHRNLSHDTTTLPTTYKTIKPKIIKDEVKNKTFHENLHNIKTKLEIPKTEKPIFSYNNASKTNDTKKNHSKLPDSNTVTTQEPSEDETFHILTEPEHITAVMSDKERDHTSVDLISVISIAGGVMMAVITVAVIIVMIERCRRPRYEDVRKVNDIRMQVMIDNHDEPPPYVRSIFHTPLPDPPTSEKCHYQPISTLDRNLKQFMRPVVVQTISPVMLENFRGILECHYDHLPRRNHEFGTMPPRCSVAPSMKCDEELLTQRPLSVADYTIETLKCEAKFDVIDSTTSEPLYAEIPCWRPPSEHAIEVVNLNGEAVTEL